MRHVSRAGGKSRMKLATIGYEGAPQDSVFAALREARVDLLVDVRAVTSSRRPGFSKSHLAAGLPEQGIGYLHLRGLGTPKEGRMAVRSGRPQDMHRIFDRHMKTPEAQHDYEALLGLMKAHKKICLMCYEHDPAECHRTIIAERVRDQLGLSVEHLTPKAV
jgi:uncharacterized protein (DUF488 family)